MMKWLPFAVCALALQADSIPAQAPQAGLTDKLKVFEPMCGKTYRGEFASSTPEKPLFDVSKWERAMNGQAVRVLHSVNNGEYGGETILMWDPSAEKVRFWYFTTAGFFTTGTMEVSRNRWTSMEKVTGNANNITEVRSTSEFRADGTFVAKSEYFRDGQWLPGHEISYVESPRSEVKFK
ncbi:MAG TPA: hypothetical protein PK640_09565 [Verrucomicrobiota bacterium]|nr:hypothetical protein [Verrucomicrobiota bacterium]